MNCGLLLLKIVIKRIHRAAISKYKPNHRYKTTVHWLEFHRVFHAEPMELPH